MPREHNLRLLVFSQVGTRWAIPVVHTAEVIHHPEILPLPSPKKDTAGLIIYREAPVPAITLGADASVTYEYGIVVRSAERSLIILSHEPGSLLTVSSTELEQDEEPPEFIRYSWENEGELVRLIDPRHFPGLRVHRPEQAR